MGPVVQRAPYRIVNFKGVICALFHTISGVTLDGYQRLILDALHG
jgi:hypothetical protein